MTAPVSVALLRKARQASEGTCFLCRCREDRACSGLLYACAWVPGSKRRLCSAHREPELAEALRALRAADREARRA